MVRYTITIYKVQITRNIVINITADLSKNNRVNDYFVQLAPKPYYIVLIVGIKFILIDFQFGYNITTIRTSLSLEILIKNKYKILFALKSKKN